AFVSGDRLAVAQLQKAVPAAEGAIVKEPYGYHSALTVTPARGQALIRDGVKRAMAKLGSLQPYRVQTPVDRAVGCTLTLDAGRGPHGREPDRRDRWRPDRVAGRSRAGERNHDRSWRSHPSAGPH